MAKHVGKDLSDDVIDRIVEKTSFSEMKKMYKKAESGPREILIAGFLGKAQILRKGKMFFCCFFVFFFGGGGGSGWVAYRGW